MRYSVFKLACCVAICILVSNGLYSQSFNWFVGDKLGIDFSELTTPKKDFNFRSAVPLEVVQFQNDVECTGVAHDYKGNIIFYTNGTEIYDPKGQIIENGENINGHYSASQCLVIARPETENQWYLITCSEEGSSNGVQYSVLDFNKPGGIVLEKNIPILSHSTERLVSVPHANGNDVWIIAHAQYSKNYSAFLITKDGIDLKSEVKSFVGRPVERELYSGVGQCKASPDRKKIAVASQSGYLEVFNFDNATGELTENFTDDDFEYRYGPYGVEFSLDGLSLFVAPFYSVPPAKIYQYEVNFLSSKSKRNVLENTNFLPRAMQMGPDGNIYVNGDVGISYLTTASPDKLRFVESFIKKDETNKHFVGLPRVDYRSGRNNEQKPNVADVAKDTLYKMPNTFTPNGDGTNDQFMVLWNIEPNQIARFKFTIFDNIGNTFYEGTDPNSVGWTGKSDDDEVEFGNYFWNLEFNYKGKKYQDKGSVLLVR